MQNPSSNFKPTADAIRLRLDSLVESEDTWFHIADAINDLNALATDLPDHLTDQLLAVLRTATHPLINALKSERTILSGAAMDLISTAAQGLGTSFEPLLPPLLPTLLALCGRPNKVVISRARSCIIEIIQSTQLASIIPYFLRSVKDKSIPIRQMVADGSLTCLNSLSPDDLGRESRLKDIEDLIRLTARDATADVRKTSRKMFQAYQILFPHRVDR
jgi:hypothetical protein